MSNLTREQLLKFAAAWQAQLLMMTWYINEFGIDTLNRLLFGLALLIAFVILFLKKDNTEKVVTAIGTVDRFLKSQKENEKAKEASEEKTSDMINDLYRLYNAFRELQKELNESEEPKAEVDEIG